MQSRVEKGSEFEKQLADTLSQLNQERRQRVFAEAAVTAKVNDVKLLWLAATSDKLVDDEGKADFENLKKIYPQLFSKSSSRHPATPDKAAAIRVGDSV